MYLEYIFLCSVLQWEAKSSTVWAEHRVSPLHPWAVKALVSKGWIPSFEKGDTGLNVEQLARVRSAEFLTGSISMSGGL
jgi:hypothetical protein